MIVRRNAYLKLYLKKWTQKSLLFLKVLPKAVILDALVKFFFYGNIKQNQ